MNYEVNKFVDVSGSSLQGKIKTTEDKNFPWILKQHYKNKKGNADWWITRFQTNPDTKKNFWRNHLQAHFN